MVAYIIKIQKLRFATMQFHDFDHSERSWKIEYCEYFHPVGYFDDMKAGL